VETGERRPYRLHKIEAASVVRDLVPKITSS
jgi:hypothetical protein